jgi:hypothetical protein
MKFFTDLHHCVMARKAMTEIKLETMFEMMFRI